MLRGLAKEWMEPNKPWSRLDDKARLRSSLDRLIHAAVALFTVGISPMACAQAHNGWAKHLMRVRPANHWISFSKARANGRAVWSFSLGLNGDQPASLHRRFIR